MATFDECEDYYGDYYCQCSFEWKDNLKKLGFKWDPKSKLWRIPAIKFNHDIYNKTAKVVRYRNYKGTTIIDYYHVHYQSHAQVKERIKANIESGAYQMERKTQRPQGSLLFE